MKRTYLFILATLVAVCAYADAPNGSGSYYSAANGKKGAALKTALCGIVQTTTEKSYDYLWTAFQTTDKRDDNKVWDMYSNITNYTFGTDQAGSYSKEGDCYNREHSFPKSWFGSNTPMYTDLHQMYPTDGYVNNQRGNLPFGETNGNTYKSANDFSKVGTCTYSGYTGKVFEPADEYKGDFARTYFYMVTRYEEKLHDWYTNYSSTDVDEVLDGNTYPGLTTWQLNMLLAWAAADPVSQKEINRNNAVYGIQKNRNPFIDYPGLEQYIWGSKVNDAFSYDNYVVPPGHEAQSGSGGGGGSGSGTGEAGTYKLTITKDDFNTTSYASNNNEKTSNAVCTTDNTKTFEVKWTSYQVMKSTSYMQWQKSKGYIYNSTDLGTIESVTVTSTDGTFTTYYGTSAQPSSSTTVGGGYFQTKVGGETGYTTKVEITFTIADEAPASSDLALMGAPVSLSFDLYNNASAQTVNYTTSGTGAVTVSGGEDYVTTSVNESTKTISVTPTAVTPSVQTITVSQAADATHEAGTTTFSVSVADSTPAPSPSSGGWVQTDITALTTSDVFVIVGTNSSGSYALPNGAGSTPAAVEVNIAGGKITSTVTDNLKWNISISSNAVTTLYTFYPNGNHEKWLYCTNSNDGVRVGTGDASGFKIKDDYIYNNSFARYLGIYNSQDWRCYKLNNNEFPTNILNQTFAFYKYAPPSQTSQTVAVGDTGYATMVAEANLEIPAGVEVYAVQVNVSNTVANLVPITAGIPAGEPVVVKANEGEYTFTYASEPVAAVANNDLIAATTDVTSDGTQYCLADFTFGIGFYQVNSGIVIPAGKAYLQIGGTGNVKLFYGFEEEDATSLNEELRIKNEESNSAIFNLAGQQVNKSQLKRGIYIVNGRKLLK